MPVKLKITQINKHPELTVLVVGLAIFLFIVSYNSVSTFEVEQKVGYVRDVYKLDGKWVAVFDNAQVLYNENMGNTDPREGLEIVPLSLRTLVKIYSLDEENKNINRYLSPLGLKNLGTSFYNIPFTATLKQNKLVRLEEIL